MLTARALTALLDGWRVGSSGPAYQALADRIRLLILDGRVVLGSRLPAERDLASRLGISRTTVTSAYGLLRESGYLRSVRGSGSVARMPRTSSVPEPEAAGYLDFTKASLPATPALLGAAEWAVQELPGYLGQSGFDPIGQLPLRRAIAERYCRRGLPTDPEQVMITIGAQHAIALLARTLLSRGDRTIVESPSYPHAFESLRGAGSRLVPVQVSSEYGWDELQFEQEVHRTSPTLGYLMPDLHNPTGRTMPADQRERIVAIAARHGTTLIADETMAELSIDAGPVPPLAAFGDAVLVGSVGKTLWGGIRVGWIRADRGMIQRLARNRSAGDLGTPVLEQIIVTRLLEQYDEILAVRREQLRAGRDFLVAALADHLPTWTVPAVHGGLTTWVNLGQPVSSQLAIAARNEGLVIAAGPRFGLDGVFERFLRVPFGYPIEDLERGVGMLERAWRQIQRRPVPVDQQDFAQVV